MKNATHSSLVLLFTLSLGLSGCFAAPKSLNVMHMGPPYQISYFDKGQPIGERKLDALSPDELVIARWIEANREGWRPSSANTPPGRVVKGEGFTLNFTKDTCYLFIPPDPTGKTGSKRKGKGITEPILLQKKLTPGDLELAQVLGTAG